MKRTPLILLLAAFVCLNALAQQPAKAALTAEDYARAERMLSYSTAPLVDRAAESDIFAGRTVLVSRAHADRQ